MSTIKRWAFMPFLILACLWVGWAVTHNSPIAGTVIAVVLLVPATVLWDRRRRYPRRSLK